MRWVLMRGLTREAGHWGDLPRRLAAALGPGHEVLTLDLPGNGTRHLERSPASVAALAQACREQLPPGAPPVLVAMSLGAMVAMEWARAVPEEVAGVLMINTSGRGHSPFWQRLQPRHYATLLRLPLMAAPQRERRVLAMTSSGVRRHAPLVAHWTRIAAERPVSAANALRQLWAAACYRAPAEAPQVPVLLLASAGDRLVSPQCSRQLAQRWQVPLRLHPWAGHDLPLDDPGWVVAEVRAWALRQGWG